MFTRPRAKILNIKPLGFLKTRKPLRNISPHGSTPTAYYYLNRPGKTCIHPFGLGYHCKNMSALYGVHSRYSSCTNDERRASCQRDTLFRPTHAQVLAIGPAATNTESVTIFQSSQYHCDCRKLQQRQRNQAPSPPLPPPPPTPTRYQTWTQTLTIQRPLARRRKPH